MRKQLHLTRTLFATLLVICSFPALAWAGEADYRAAREHLIDDRFDDALALFRQVAEEDPPTEVADDAQYYVAYTLERLGRREEAIQAYDELLRQWPDSMRTDSARSHRAELMGEQDTGRHQESLELILSSASWEVRRDTAVALAQRGDLSAADILDEMMRRESTSRQIELVQILGRHTADPTARRLLMTALESSHATSVQLSALESLDPVTGEVEVANAIGRALSEPLSTSVKIKAVQVLAPRANQRSARVAIANGLATDNSTSVQIAACKALEGHLLDEEIRAEVLDIFRAPASTSVQIKLLEGLERDRDRPAAATILREAISGAGSTSVQIKALKIAGASANPQVRAVASLGLTSHSSTSSQLEALKVVAQGRNEPQATTAILGLFENQSTSTSVQLAAIEALENHMETPQASRALAAALAPGLSTSVQLKALGLAVRYRDEPEVQSALVALLRRSSTSTSVQLQAVELLTPRVDEAEVRAVVGEALRSDNSTSVQLKAVAALERQTQHPEVRRQLIETLERDRSTSVVLESMKALAAYVGSDGSVTAAFIRVMESHRISSSARVLAAEELLPEADEALRLQIADAMEDVVVRLRRDNRFSRPHDLIEDALDVLEQIDPQRAKRLAR